MDYQDVSRLSDDELREEFRKIVPSPIFDAFFIGFLIGIIIFGVVTKGWGFFMLIPLFLIRVFLRKGARHEALKKEIEARNSR